IALRQTRVGELSMWKGAAFANSARNGVFSALLAGHGMTGPAPIFEGEKGILKQVSGPINLTPSEFGGKEKPFRIMDTYIKFYPAEYHSQSAINAALELRPEIMAAGGIEAIQSVTVQTPLASYQIIGSEKEKWAPKSRETADHSLPYIVGIALIDGKVGMDQFEEAKFTDHKVLQFLKKIEIVRDEVMDREYPAGVPNEVAIRMNSGKILSRKILYPKGHAWNPLTDDEVEGKFKALSRGVMPRQKADEIIDRIWKIEKLKDCGALMSLFIFSKGKQ
ncbi:MAG TPA: MmgE/PrpD family protein, partial [Nitrospiria bacterium]|nr:MmgE/PrpD family protein [Nitrospiria bacterium]